MYKRLVTQRLKTTILDKIDQFALDTVCQMFNILKNYCSTISNLEQTQPSFRCKRQCSLGMPEKGIALGKFKANWIVLLRAINTSPDTDGLDVNG